eukprot:1160160-Pelagomonas_calceolata.AAC.5
MQSDAGRRVVMLPPTYWGMGCTLRRARVHVLCMHAHLEVYAHPLRACTAKIVCPTSRRLPAP